MLDLSPVIDVLLYDMYYLFHDKQKEELIEKIEAKLNQKITEEELFTIRWRLV